MKADRYEAELERLQLALVRWQGQAIVDGQRTVVVFEGRDAAGKDGAIKRIVEHLSPRSTRVTALPKPSDRERSQWFLQRYVAHLPAAGELVLFNRSWYNRAGVERVMGFSSAEEQETFLGDARAFEAMLVGGGITLLKLWLDISKAEQAGRLAERASDPLKALKISPLDGEAQARWEAYTSARDRMLRETHTDAAPWICVATDDKRTARLNVMRRLLMAVAPGAAEPPDEAVAFTFDEAAIGDGRLAP